MNRKTYFLPLFFLSIALCFCVFFFSHVGFFAFVQNSVLNTIFPLGNVLTAFVYPENKKTDERTLLKKQNTQLSSQLVKMQTLEEDNKALRDQFQTQNPASILLLPAWIVGMPAVVPNITFPETLIIDRGEEDAISTEMPVVVENNLVGIIHEAASHFSQIVLTTNKQTSLSAKDSSTNAQGVLKGLGNGEMIFENVLISESLHVNDLVVTMGSQDLSGKGYPPNLIVGTITSIEKNPSSLFQSARVSPLIDITHTHLVFILK